MEDTIDKLQRDIKPGLSTLISTLYKIPPDRSDELDFEYINGGIAEIRKILINLIAYVGDGMPRKRGLITGETLYPVRKRRCLHHHKNSPPSPTDEML